MGIIKELWEALAAAPNLSVQGTLPCNSDDDGCEKGVDDFCTDLWKAYVGDPSCADKVGCGGDYSDVNSEVIGLAPSTTGSSNWNVKSRSHEDTCHIEGNCISDSVSGDYASSQVCEFEYVGNAEITRKSWGLEPHASCSFDWLTMGGTKYCGTATSSNAFPSSTTVSGTTNFKFETDGSVESSGFELCATPSSSLLMKYSDSVQQTLTSSAIPQALLIAVGVAVFSMVIVATVGIRRWKLRQETDVTPLPADISNL